MAKTFDYNLQERVSRMYSKASIHTANKFIVGFWGDAVNSAIQYLSDYAVFDPLISSSAKIYDNNRIYSGILTEWLNIHCPGISLSKSSFSNGYARDVIKSVDAIELLWACEKISFPGTVTPKTSDVISMDTYKNIKYPIITGHSGPGSISLTITEDRMLMFYQFFNALMNQFFNPLILKARSSIHKLGMYIIVLDGFSFANTEENLYFTETGMVRDQTEEAPAGWHIGEAPLQVFEYNSVILENVGELSYDSTNITSKASYSIKIKAPNLFQDAFKTMQNFRGLKNNSTDLYNSTSNANDFSIIRATGNKSGYNIAMLEESSM